MKWMCYGAGLLVATTSLLAGTGVLVALVFAAGSTAIMGGIARRALSAELPAIFMRSSDGSLLQGVAMFIWGSQILEPPGMRGSVMVVALVLFAVGWFLEIRERSTYAPED